MPADQIHRRTYVISDLHLGGDGPSPDKPSDRGFRIFTRSKELCAFIDHLIAMPAGSTRDRGIPRVELVINGDIVDFLAETDGPKKWSAVKSARGAALKAFKDIATREALFFKKLAALLAKGHRLTLLLGNHDIELAFPDVRQWLEELLGYDGGQDFHFIYDGEAYTIGDVLIEHGNRYDPFNVTDNDSLRRARSLMSRNQEVPEEYAFQASAGSHIVAEILNPIKVHYPFIDLLKPENETVLPMLLALEPNYRSLIGKFVLLAAQSRRRRLAAAAMPSAIGDIAGEGDGIDESSGMPISAVFDETPTTAEPQADHRAIGAALAVVENASPEIAADGVLASVLGNGFMAFEAALLDKSVVTPGEISGFIDRARQYAGSLLLMITHRAGKQIQRRMPALRAALGAVIENQSFDPKIETGADYLQAAEKLAANGFKLIIFGHTHLPKEIDLKTAETRYFNTGTWADMIKFDKGLMADPPVPAKGGNPKPSPLQQFVNAIKNKEFTEWIDFSPYYVRLDFTRNAEGKDTLTQATLLPFKSSAAEV